MPIMLQHQTTNDVDIGKKWLQVLKFIFILGYLCRETKD